MPRRGARRPDVRPYPERVDELSSTTGIVALAAAGVALLALLLCVLLAVRLRRLRADQRLVLGERREDLVAHAAGLNRHVAQLRQFVERESLRFDERLNEAEERLDGAVTHSAVVRYDAFNETSGRQSSTIALLDDRGDGVVLSAILQREQARVYAKPITGGRSALDLSPEEIAAMQEARRERPDLGPAAGSGGFDESGEGGERR